MNSGAGVSRHLEERMLDVSCIHDVPVVNVSGDLSRHNMRFLEDMFKSFLERGQLNLILNFENLKHIDYQLVRRFADHIVVFQCEGGDIKVANASRYVREILMLMGLEEEFYPSVEDALMSFHTARPDGELQ